VREIDKERSEISGLSLSIMLCLQTGIDQAKCNESRPWSGSP